MGCAADTHHYMCDTLAERFLDLNFSAAVIEKNIKFLSKLPQISHIHKNRIFKVSLKKDRPTASSL